MALPPTRISRDALCVLTLLLIGLAIAVPLALQRPYWSPDGLFYEAQKKEVQGASAQQARREVWAGDAAAQLKRAERDLPPGLRRVDNPAWVEYSAQNYRRRWTVPALAAALDPVAGERSLGLVSLLGFVAFGPALFLLLRRRFAPASAIGATLPMVVMPPLLTQAPSAGTDTWGLTLLTVGLLLALLVRDRGPRWLAGWIAAVLLLSFTRDATAILVIAAAWLAFQERSRRMVAVLATGIAAALPAPLLFSLPLREHLAYVFNDLRIPTDTRWSAILGEYPSALVELVRSDLRYPLETAVPPYTMVLGVLALAGLATVVAHAVRGDRFARYMTAAGAGGLLMILAVPDPTDLRLELVLLPVAATGVALLAERFSRWRSDARTAVERARPHAAVAGPAPG